MDQQDVGSVIAEWSRHHEDDNAEQYDLDEGEFDDGLLAPLSREQLIEVVNAAVCMDSEGLWQAAVNALRRKNASRGARDLSGLSYNDIVGFLP